MSKPVWSEAETWQLQATEWQREALRLRRALDRIAKLDYRGNRHESATIAEQALRDNNSDSTKACVLCGAKNPTESAENEAGDGYEPMCKRCWDDQTEAHPYG